MTDTVYKMFLTLQRLGLFNTNPDTSIQEYYTYKTKWKYLES